MEGFFFFSCKYNIDQFCYHFSYLYYCMSGHFVTTSFTNVCQDKTASCRDNLLKLEQDSTLWLLHSRGEMALAKSIAMKAFSKSAESFGLKWAFCRGAQAHRIRAFSALMSPPSKAVVYEREGPPDAVTKYTYSQIFCLCILRYAYIFFKFSSEWMTIIGILQSCRVTAGWTETEWRVR